jgi:DNA mismatch repair protein MutS2
MQQTHAIVQPTTQPILEERGSWKPRIGDTVWLSTLNIEGHVVEISGTDAMVQVGNLRVRAEMSELQKREASAKRQMKRGQVRQLDESETVYARGKSPGLELDLRGQRVDVALQAVDKYVDAAYNSGLPFGRIIHGKGTGALRKAIRDQLQGHKLIASFETAHPNEGGDGVTVIHLAPQV